MTNHVQEHLDWLKVQAHDSRYEYHRLIFSLAALWWEGKLSGLPDEIQEYGVWAHRLAMEKKVRGEQPRTTIAHPAAEAAEPPGYE